MKKLVGLMMVSFLILLSACGNSSSKHSASAEEVKDLVNYYSITDVEEGINANIDSKVMTLTDKKGNVIESMDLPEDEFFLSIAPFKKDTHPCSIHSLSGCQGELVEEALHVTVVDSKGKTIIDEDMETMKNGFIDLWLPRNQEFKVTITDGILETMEVLSTYDDSRTCITTMQLK
ncbi:CueP family metal-binding protein [Phocicoccus pinnipedialis]|uniref:Lipocalin-like domain-containing protein n=1 Tax=Phocicoccus pinnipedialis TaxID=110845 RepID=A0A6V7R4Q4_9BACL|nr:CueP family metal-binding protein [Jeotgalicoccus pinnipedialis]MBP1939779.1 hypothetical protein [Jeotgalicoccus pinnipedialis]CAD2072407.1 hypothetical protein JEOPIN946_00500 [Jeotgalicoccus pinnipedialis]